VFIRSRRGLLCVSVRRHATSSRPVSFVHVSSQGKYRAVWEEFYTEVNAVMFVLDASDKMRICVAKDELENLLKNQGA
jgi:ADP-ribosylation factor-like protein 6